MALKTGFSFHGKLFDKKNLRYLARGSWFVEQYKSYFEKIYKKKFFEKKEVWKCSNRIKTIEKYSIIVTHFCSLVVWKCSSLTSFSLGNWATF